MSSFEACKSKKTLQQTNRCVMGFQHGKKKLKMEDEYAEGPLGRDYGDGYKAGREYAFEQTGSRRKITRKNKKTKKNRKIKTS
jgi:hypothetical protein